MKLLMSTEHDIHWLVISRKQSGRKNGGFGLMDGRGGSADAPQTSREVPRFTEVVWSKLIVKLGRPCSGSQVWAKSFIESSHPFYDGLDIFP